MVLHHTLDPSNTCALQLCVPSPCLTDQSLQSNHKIYCINDITLAVFNSASGIAGVYFHAAALLLSQFAYTSNQQTPPLQLYLMLHFKHRGMFVSYLQLCDIWISQDYETIGEGAFVP